MAETVCLLWSGDKQKSPADAPAHTLRAQAVVIEELLNLAAEGQDFEDSFRTALRMIRDIDQDILRDHIKEVPSRVLSALSLIKVMSVDTLQEYPPARFVVGIDAAAAAVKRWHETWWQRPTEKGPLRSPCSIASSKPSSLNG